jgi:hypothetical protein
MSFVGKHSCYSFSPASIRQNAPPLPGIYALSNAREWLFAAESDNVQESLRIHLAEAGTRLRDAAPTGFTFEVCDPATRSTRLARLIHELNPSCNLPAHP